MTADLAIEVEALGRGSKRAAWTGAVGLGILCGSLLFAGWRVSSVEGKVRDAEKLVAHLQGEVEELNKTKSGLRKDVGELAREKQGLETKNLDLEKEVARLRGPLAKLIEVRGSSQPLNIKDPKGQQLYDFTVWLKLPEFRKPEIEKVRYHFDHPSVILRDRVATNPENGFSVSYRGWGCFPGIEVIVTTTGKEDLTLPFDQCAHLARAAER